MGYQVLFINGSVAERFRHHPFKMGYARSIRVTSTSNILRPYCHTQTDNYGSKNAKNKERGMTSSSEDSGL